MIVVYNEAKCRFEAITSFFERHIPKAAQWRWDQNTKRWWAPSEDIGRRLAQYAQGSAAERLVVLSDDEKRALALSTATDSELPIPAPAGLAYLPFQKAGIAFALEQRNALIADEMGLGKTIQAIGVANSIPLRRALIVCPASLRLNWRAEWRRWHTGRLRAQLLDTWPRIEGSLFGVEAQSGQAMIVSYDSVQKWHPMIAEVEWDLLVLDEAHLIKDARTRRARSILGGRYGEKRFAPLNAGRTLALTGTPIVNRPEELWPLLRLLAPSGIGARKSDFIARYAGSERLAELHSRLRSSVMVRRLKADVLKELPLKRRQLVPLDVAGADRLIAGERQAIDLASERLRRLRDEIDGLPHQEQVMRLRQGRAVALSEIARVRHETALAKLPAAVEHISEVLGNVDKLVVFSHHHDVTDRLVGEFGRIAQKLDGRDDERARAAAVAAFQQDRRCRVFIGSIRAAGLGLTLTAASTVIFIELDWTPAAMSQAEDRCHRIGQHDSVLVQHLVIDGSIDAKMSLILMEKQRTIDAALDGKAPEAASRDILSEVLRA